MQLLARGLSRRGLVLGGAGALSLAPDVLLARQCEATATDDDQRKRINFVLDEYIAAYEALDAARFVALMAKDIYFEDPTFHLMARNAEEMRPLYEPLGKTIFNVKVTPLNRIVAPPWGISQQRLAGTHIGEKGGEKQFDVQGVTMLEVRDGLIRRWYDYYDVLTFQKQIG